MKEIPPFSQPITNTSEEVTNSSHHFFDRGKDTRGSAITPRIRELKKSTTIEDTLWNTEVSKHEVYAVTGFLMEGLLNEVNDVLQNNDIVAVNAISIIQNECPALTFDGEKFSLSPGWETAGKLAYQSIWNLRGFLMYFMNDVIAGEIGNLGKEEHRAFERLHFLVKEKARWNRGHEKKYKDGFSLLKAGVGTASEEAWGMMSVVPVIFYEQFGRDMTEAEFDQVMRSGGDTLLRIASLPIYNLSALGSGEERKPEGYLKLAKERYTLTGEPGSLEISFQRSFLDKAHLHSWFTNLLKDNSKDPTLGCPVKSIAVEDKHGRMVNGIQGVVNFYADLAKQVILPHQQVLRDAAK